MKFGTIDRSWYGEQKWKTKYLYVLLGHKKINKYQRKQKERLNSSRQ